LTIVLSRWIERLPQFFVAWHLHVSSLASLARDLKDTLTHRQNLLSQCQGVLNSLTGVHKVLSKYLKVTPVTFVSCFQPELAAALAQPLEVIPSPAKQKISAEGKVEENGENEIATNRGTTNVTTNEQTLAKGTERNRMQPKATEDLSPLRTSLDLGSWAKALAMTSMSKSCRSRRGDVEHSRHFRSSRHVQNCAKSSHAYPPGMPVAIRFNGEHGVAGGACTTCRTCHF